MNEITIFDLINLVESYNPGESKMILKAYDFAKRFHAGQKRQSGEPYIIHPLNVAYILAQLHADRDSICAGLLHDTLEDTVLTYDDIKEFFNEDVALLVEGVTNLSGISFVSKEELQLANTRKIIMSLKKDVRILIVKLADRLHNMRTLNFKRPEKQQQKSLETMKVFVPLADNLGFYDIRSELEDLALSYLHPLEYQKICAEKACIESEYLPVLKDMLNQIRELLLKAKINTQISTCSKNVCGIYEKRYNQGLDYNEIHDLLALKIIVEQVSDCYTALGIVHSLYHPLNNKFKDYIANQKTNLYQSLHTTVFAKDDRLVQMQIRTEDMEKINSNGLIAYWDFNKGEAPFKMQKDISHFPFFQSLGEIDEVCSDNKEFIKRINDEVFADQIYIYTTKGDVIALPKGSTPIDVAYQIHTDIGNTMIGALVNDQLVPCNYVLHSKDIVKILCDENALGPQKEWESYVQTTRARRRIKEFNAKKNTD